MDGTNDNSVGRLYNGYASKGGQGTSTYGHDTQGGDGGIAGKGGIIITSKSATIYAFNGNMYTDGTNYDSGKNQLEIFAQKGILRDVYKYSLFFDNREGRYKDFFYNLFGNTVSSDLETFNEINTRPIKNYLIRPETTCNLSGYINPITSNSQGIGSGAGYIELDNGSFEVKT